MDTNLKEKMAKDALMITQLSESEAQLKAHISQLEEMIQKQNVELDELQEHKDFTLKTVSKKTKKKLLQQLSCQSAEK
jgi:hypothetical protein